MNQMTNRVTLRPESKLQQDDLFIPSEVKLLSDLTGIPSRRGLDRAIISGGEIVNIVSSGYGHLPNEIFFKEAERSLQDAGLEFMQRTINRNNRSFAADFILSDPSVTIELKGAQGSPDKIKPMLRFLNAYDGSIKTSGSFGFFREVCSNGLHIAESTIGFSMKHTSGIQEIVIDRIGDLTKQFIDNEYYTLRRKFEVLFDCEVNDPKLFAKALCKRSGIFKYEASEKNPEPGANARLALNIAHAEADQLGVKLNAWHMYNAFNSVLHNKMSKTFSEQHRLDQGIFGASLELAGAYDLSTIY
jgi:hypothetical protein